MDFEKLLNEEQAMQQPATPLFAASLFKTIGETDSAWRFSGIASDEDVDTDGDAIMRKSLDLSYANQRGYVNWDHSREPEYQLGYLTKATLVSKKNVEELRKNGFPNLSETATVYMEGELYKANTKAQHVHEIMKSTPEGAPGLGLSLDGAVARDTKNGGIVKAFVRGVAITPQPAQPKTLVRMMKSIQAYNELQVGNFSADLPAEIASQVVELMQKGTTKSQEMKHDEAVLWVLRERPNWTYDLAKKVVALTMTHKERN